MRPNSPADCEPILGLWKKMQANVAPEGILGHYPDAMANKVGCSEKEIGKHWPRKYISLLKTNCFLKIGLQF